MTNNHSPKENTYVHTFACTFPSRPQIAAEVLFAEYPEQAVELAKAIFTQYQYISVGVARLILDEVTTNSLVRTT